MRIHLMGEHSKIEFPLCPHSDKTSNNSLPLPSVQWLRAEHLDLSSPTYLSGYIPKTLGWLFNASKLLLWGRLVSGRQNCLLEVPLCPIPNSLPRWHLRLGPDIGEKTIFIVCQGKQICGKETQGSTQVRLLLVDRGTAGLYLYLERQRRTRKD